MHVTILWMVNCEEAYYTLCKLWVSKEFQDLSKKHIWNYCNDPKHTYSTNNHILKVKHMINCIISYVCNDYHIWLVYTHEVATIVALSDVEVYIARHHGTNSSNLEQLCSHPCTKSSGELTTFYIYCIEFLSYLAWFVYICTCNMVRKWTINLERIQLASVKLILLPSMLVELEKATNNMTYLMVFYLFRSHRMLRQMDINITFVVFPQPPHSPLMLRPGVITSLANLAQF